MRWILSVDPGSEHSGAALLEEVPGKLPHLIETWDIVTAAEKECSARVTGRGTSRGQQRLETIEGILCRASEMMQDAHVQRLVVVTERCPVTARAQTGRSGSQALIGWALGRVAGMWQYGALERRYDYDEIEVGPHVLLKGKRVRGGWRGAFPLLKRGTTELELVARLWPGSNVKSEHVAAAVLIGAGYLMGGR